MERTSCPLDGTFEATIVRKARDVEFGGIERFSIVRCTRCGMHYLNPRPGLASIGAYYPAVYYTHRGPDLRRDARVYRLPARLVHEHGRPGTLMDIGAGGGGLLTVLQDEGWPELAGIEPDPEAARAAQGRGLDVAVGGFPHAPLDVLSIDTATMFEVLEHLHDPVAALREVATALKPGGRLILSTPNYAGLEFRLLGAHSVSLQVPRHLMFFERRSLDFALRAAGLEPVLLRTTGTLTGLTRSLWLWARPGNGGYLDGAAVALASDGPSWRGRIHGLLDVVLLPVAWIANSLGFGPTLVAVARKP